MNSEVEQIIRRTYGYYFEDGLVEMGLGLLFIASGLLFLTWSMLQAASWQGAVLALVSVLIVVGGVYGLRWAIGRIKERVSYPRSGYASYREGEPSIARWLILVVVTGVVVAGILFPTALERLALMEGALLGAILFYMGYRVGLKRFYLLGILSLTIGVAAMFLFNDDILGSAMTFGLSGVLLLLSGLLTFVDFLHRHPKHGDDSYE